jgi:hypothetical protein
MNQFLATAAPLALILLVYALVWCVVLTLIGRASGWWALARKYRYTGHRFDGSRWRFQHIQLRWSMNYSGCVTVGASTDGIYLGLIPWFDIGHPKIFVPWAETKVEMKHTRWTGEYMEITFPNVPGTVVRFGERLAKRIAATFNTSPHSIH